MSELREYRLSDIMQIVGGGTPKTSNPAYWNGDIPWLSVVDFGNQLKYVHNTEKSITSSGLSNSSTKILPKGSLVISARGTVGALAMLTREMAFNQSCYGLIANKQFCGSDYLYYLLKVKISELKQKAYGAVFDTITRQTFDTIIVKLPSLETQQEIAEILSSLDDKIELNNKINAGLEKLAQTIYKQWFVDFEFPDENGNSYKSSGGEMVDSELGMIPKGWKIKQIRELIEVKDGTHASPKKVEIGRFLITSKHLLSNGTIDYSSANLISKMDYDEVNKRSKVDTFDILITMIGTVGNLLFVDENPNFAIKNIGLFKTSQKPKEAHFVYEYLRSYRLQNYLKERMTGSTQQYLTLNTLRSIPIFDCNNMIVEFSKLMKDVRDKISSINKENASLGALRDLLIKKLIK